MTDPFWEMVFDVDDVPRNVIEALYREMRMPLTSLDETVSRMYAAYDEPLTDEEWASLLETLARLSEFFGGMHDAMGTYIEESDEE